MECEICLNPWNTDNIIPKILPCGHIFCQKCLEKALTKLKKQKSSFKCLSCKNEIKSITSYKDIINLKSNNALLSLIGKKETQKIKTNVSNASLSMSFQINNEAYLNSEIYSNSQNEENLIGNYKNNYKNIIYNNTNSFPICQIHKSKANFYLIKNAKIIYICNECLQTEEYQNLKPLPSLKVQNKYKIDSCISKIQILKEEINRVENFLKTYQNNFETEYKKKINELFDYINKIVLYNKTTAETLFYQCKKEQKSQIDKKIQELYFLRNELDLFDKKLKELLDLNKKGPLPESQIELDNVYNKLGNYLNYENELYLFTINIHIKEDIKGSLFDLIQNSCHFDIDFLKMKNGELPTINDLLNKSIEWSCNCGDKNNKKGKIICNSCSKYRSLETYKNIIFNPMLVTNAEKKELHMRRRHEKKVFQTLMKKIINYKKNNFYFALESSWFKNWKCFISNDLTEQILINNEKHVSENTTIGVLPPGPINNRILCDENEAQGKFKLKPGLIIKKDYYIINQLLWEWFLLNYDGGPEIMVENNKVSKTYLYCIKENIPKLTTNENNLKTEKKNNKNKGNNKKDNIIEENEEFLEEKLYNDINDSRLNEYLYENNTIKAGIKIKNIMIENIEDE